MADIGFSVVIPTYNRVAHVAPCLAPFLEADAAGIEVIVVDDGSSDATQQEVEAAARRSQGAEIRFVRQANAGPGAARNRGAGMVRSGWIVFLDIDDRWFPWTIAAVRRALAEAGDASLLFLNTRNFVDDAELEQLRATEVRLVRHIGFLRFDQERPMPTFGSCNAGVRRDAFQAVGGFETSIRCAEDIDLFYRLEGTGSVISAIGVDLVGYRLNSGGSLSSNPVLMREGLDFMERELARGRYPGPEAELRAMMNRRRTRWARIYFARGMVRAPYGLLLPDMPTRFRTLGVVEWLKLVLTPPLSLVRPSNYHFGWRAFLRGTS
jgi:glycosyltransferase involved in cell wall biosynthesis